MQVLEHSSYVHVTRARGKVWLTQRRTFLLERAGDEKRRSMNTKSTQDVKRRGKSCFKHSVLFQEGSPLAETEGLRKGDMEIEVQR